MRSIYRIENLSNFIQEISDRNNKNAVNEVFSVTNTEGFVRSTDYFDKEVFSKNVSNYKIVKPKQFAYNPSRINVGSIAFLGEEREVIISPLYVVFQCSGNLIPEYLLTYLKSPIGILQIRSKTRGAVRDNLTFSRLGEIEIPIPSIEEQVKIVELLEKIESLKRKREECLRLIDLYLNSCYKELFGDPIRNDKGFEKYRLGDLGEWQSGGTPSRSNEGYFTGDIPWITSGELNEIYVSDSKEKISIEALRNSNAKMIEDDSLLLGMYDTAALKSSITKGKIACNQAIAFSKLNRELCNTIYIYFSIQIGKEYFRRHQRGARQQNLNLSMIKNIEVPIPQIELQDRFAQIVERTLLVKQSFLKSLNELLNLHYATSLSAFKGDLDLSRISVDHILPIYEVSKDGSLNIKAVSNKENKGNLSRKESLLRTVTYKYFNSKKFSFEELAEKVQLITEEEFDYKKLKNQIFDSIRGKGDIKLSQSYDDIQKRILLHIDK